MVVKILKSLFIIFISLFVLLLIWTVCFLLNEKKISNDILFCDKNSMEAGCYEKAFEYIIPKLLLYKVKIDFSDIDLVKRDWSARLAAKQAMEKSDLLLGYGLFDDVVFEANYGCINNKPAYGFDCTQDLTKIQNKYLNCKFFDECIGNDNFILPGQISSGKFHTFSQKIKELKLQDKKIFVKMDIAGAELDVLPEILKYSNQITGMLITFHPESYEYLRKMPNILDDINKDFHLVSRNTLYKRDKLYKKNLVSLFYNFYLVDYTLVLSYVNKNIVSDVYIPLNQNSNSLYKNVKFEYCMNERYNETDNFLEMPKNNINFIVPLVHKIKNIVR